ncbi:DUF6383 domain-containing protein [Parabacteroides johnsonii]|uniref:DUF6383 domain-containing protein n=1 Tax=Parabacteroides johnsonii TaxID=387661 RepID=UPI00242E581D|nr:DUF6383 domain-containing protein [Parabacteroides johnsonii]
MNKKISTLLAGVALMGAVSANAAVVDGNYYHLQTQEVGATSGSTLNLVLTKNYLGTKTDSIIAVVSTEAEAKTDSALWKIVSEKVDGGGNYLWTITNKAVPSVRLSFGAGSNAVGDNGTLKINNADASAYGLNLTSSLSGAMKFAWGDPSGVDGTAAVISSYVSSKDSTLCLAVKVGAAENFSSNKKFPLIRVMNGSALTAGSVDEENPVISLVAKAPAKSILTAKELNAKKNGNGFELFAKFKGAVATDGNPLSGVIFKAQTVGTIENSPAYDDEAPNTGYALQAVNLPKKGNRPQYLFVDTMSFDSQNAKLKLKVDTLPRKTAGAYNASSKLFDEEAYTFYFAQNPGAPADSVAIFVKGTYTLGQQSSPHTYSWGNTNFHALSVEESNGKTMVTLVETTGPVQAATALANLTQEFKNSIISFNNTTATEGLFALDKVYSVKCVNEDEARKYDAGKYLINTLAGDGEYVGEAAYKLVPATQFIYNGVSLVNRENTNIMTGGLVAVEGKEDVYTNGTDTLEIKEIAGVDVKENTIGYTYMTEDSIKNYGFSLDYVSGALEGYSINAGKDSIVKAVKGESVLFKLEAVGEATEYGAENDKIAKLEKTTYKLYLKNTVNGKKIYVIDNNGVLAVSNETSAATPAEFLLKTVNDEGEVILVNAAGTNKYNVNSSTLKLEEVTLATAGNNAFKVQVEEAPEYVLDAAGKHMSFTTVRGDNLTADKNNFAVFRKIGEELKSTYSEADFSLFIDTAQGLVQKPTEPTYYIMKGAKVGEKAALEGNFLRVMTDSIDVEGYSILVNGDKKAKLAFVPAKRLEVGGDSLLVNYQNETLTKNDSVGFKNKKAGIDQFRFKIQYTENADEYLLRNNNNYIAVLNDVIFLTDKANEAAVLSTAEVSAPTANEGVEVSEVTVIAGEGNVTVVGAAGKKVVISNILGQSVANTVITSDNATIAAPQGVVVVAVEGEEAVKAIVK